MAAVLSDKVARALLDRGTALLHSGDAAAALPLLRQAAAALPDDARAAFRLGSAAFLCGDFDAAAAGFTQATQRDPAWVEAWNNLAAALARLQRIDDGVAASRAAMRLAPDRIDSRQTLSALLSHRFDRESLVEGLQLADEALRVTPDHAETQRTAAILHGKLGDPAQAERHARQAASLAPQDPMMIELLGDALLERDAAADAVTVLHDAVARGVGSPAVTRQLGIALLRSSRLDEAITVLGAARRQDPDDQRSIAHLGVALAAAGRVDEAERLLGVQRNVHAVALPSPAGFADDASFRHALADDIRRHSQQRWEPIGLAARQAYLSGDLLRDRTQAIVGLEAGLREAIDAFIAGCRHDARDAFLHRLPAQYRLHVWATRAAQGGFIDTHIHEQSWLSGAYYVTLPAALESAEQAAGYDDAERAATETACSEQADPHAGWIEFGRPPRHLPAVDDALLRTVRPRAGELLLFPSYLFHRTLPYAGDGERISVSFDLAAA